MANAILSSIAGVVLCLFGSGDDAGLVEVARGTDSNGKKIVRFKMDDVRVHVPVTREALDEAFKAYTYEVTDVEGTTYQLKGVDAAACAKYFHSLESVRGTIRTDEAKDRLMGEASYRQMFLDFFYIGGGSRGGRRAPQVSKDALKGAVNTDGTVDHDKLKRILEAHGVKVM